MLVGHHRTDNSAYAQTTSQRGQVNEPVAPHPQGCEAYGQVWMSIEVMVKDL